jgi:hypothetical protein
MLINNSEVPVTRYMLVDGSKLEIDLRTGDIKQIKAVVPTETKRNLSQSDWEFPINLESV